MLEKSTDTFFSTYSSGQAKINQYFKESHASEPGKLASLWKIKMKQEIIMRVHLWKAKG